VISPLETHKYRAKYCDNCGADFFFSNSELTPRDVPDALAQRGYFKDSGNNLSLACVKQEWRDPYLVGPRDSRRIRPILGVHGFAELPLVRLAK
jgi:hypothetical protein